MNGSHASEAREALEALVEAGTSWATAGHGQPLVHAAVVALTAASIRRRFAFSQGPSTPYDPHHHDNLTFYSLLPTGEDPTP